MSLVSIVFTTHNRKDLLNQAIKAVQSQTISVEIIVVDDASNDGTDEMMKSEFPQIKYERSVKSLGPSYQRNRGAKIANSEIVIFLDDDTIVQDVNTLETIVRDFSSEVVGVVTIPFINILQNNLVQTGAPDKDKNYYYHAFVAAAFAVKRDTFLNANGFREAYFYMGEEGDFCIRLLEAGYYVKAGTSKPVYHYQPPKRVSFYPDFYGRRNDILFLYLNAPREFVIPHVIKTIAKGLLVSLRPGHFKNMTKGIWAGLLLLQNKEIRKLIKPVGKSTYAKFCFMKKEEPVTLEKMMAARLVLFALLLQPLLLLLYHY